ncbi:MAG: TRAP transporter small permease [Synergistaceae bacterium]|nr:TRAP transporter small permease [Synergistaceae bacterium]
MRDLKWCLDNAERIICAALTLIILAVLSLSIFSRYVLNMSISWAEELSIFGLIWLTYFGSVIAVQERRHLRVTVIELFLSRGQRKVLEIICNAVFFGFCLFIVHGAFKMTVMARDAGHVGVATNIPRWAVIAGMCLAFWLMAVRLIQDTVKLLREYRDLKKI